MTEPDRTGGSSLVQTGPQFRSGPDTHVAVAPVVLLGGVLASNALGEMSAKEFTDEKDVAEVIEYMTVVTDQQILAAPLYWVSPGVHLSAMMSLLLFSR